MKIAKCDRCKKEVKRRITTEDNIKVCRECKMELSEENYEKWVNLIIKKDTK